MEETTAPVVSAALRRQGLNPVAPDARREGIKVRRAPFGAVSIRVDFDSPRDEVRLAGAVVEALAAAGFTHDAPHGAIVSNVRPAPQEA